MRSRKLARRSRPIWSAVAVVASLVAGACGGGDDSESGGDVGECPLDALDSVEEPVEIEFWHVMTRANEEALIGLTDEFNASQDKVKINLVNNADADDQWEKYRAGLETGDLPDMVQHQDLYLQQMIDTQSALPVQSCMDAEDFDTEDYVERALDYYSVGDVQWAMPFSTSTTVLIYNRDAFTRAGLDPDDPPDTLEELRSAAQAIKDAGFEAGMGLKLDWWHMEQFLALAGEPLVNNANGRESRTTEVAFDGEAGDEVFAYLAGLVEDGLAVTNPRSGPGQFDNLLGIGGERYGMTLDTSAALGTIMELLQSGQYPNVDPGVAAMPGRTENGGVLAGGSALYISSTDPATQAGAWEFMKFLTTPENQAVWAAASGYVPVRTSATELPELQARWTEIPGFKVAYDQLVEGAVNDATAGPVIGDFAGVRAALEQAENRMFLEHQDPADAVADAAAGANEAIQSYNERIGE